MPVADVPLPNEDSCVARALESSTEIADYRDEALQAGRALAQSGWDYVLGDITLTAGMWKQGRGAHLELLKKTPDDKSGAREWALDAVGTKRIDEPDEAFFEPRDTSLRYTASIELAFPIFRGAKRHGTQMELGARYMQARAELIDETRNVERRVREAYYDYEASRTQLEISEERVAIAAERYELAEAQHELGRMSDEGLDSFREGLFGAQDAFSRQQFATLEREEDLRALIRQFD